MKQISNHRKGESGQALVEFTFMLPILLAVLIGMSTFALLFYSYLSLQLAVREGTNAIIENPDTQTGSSIVSLVQADAFTLDQSSVNVVVVPYRTGSETANPWSRGVRVSVTASYTVTLPTASIPMFGGGTVRFGPVPLQAESIMTIN